MNFVESSELKVPSQTSETTPEVTGGLTEKQRSFAANVFKAFEKTMSDNDRLSALYVVDSEKFEEEIKAQVDDYLAEDAEYQVLLGKIKEARKYDREGGLPFMPDVKARHSKARELIITTLNLPENYGSDEIEQATNNVQTILKDVPKDPEHKDVALLILGAKTPIEDTPGEYEYSFPYELFPDKINDKWADYLETVKDHLEAEKIHRTAPTDETGHVMSSIDTVRRQKHEALTRAVYPILGLEQFGYSKKSTMELLAKMRTDELMLDRKPHPSVHLKTTEEKAVAKKLARKRYEH